MATPELELDRKALERELKLAKLEADFYRANSATRKESIELDNIKNCLLQELVEIEENKNVELRSQIEVVQVVWNATELYWGEVVYGGIYLE